MKKIISIIIAIAFLGMVGTAQVPDNFKDKFKTAHPDATAVNWTSVDQGIYKVSYTENEIRHVIVYDKNMGPVWSRVEIPPADYPKPIMDYFKTVAPDKEKEYKLYRVSRDGATVYYSPILDKKVIYFDKEGKMMRTEMETTEYPKAISEYYVKKYPDQKYVIYSTDENGNITYYTMHKGKRVYFDRQGNYLRDDYDYDYDFTVQ